MKAILRLELRIDGLSDDGTLTHEYHTVGAVLNLPAIPDSGRHLYFNSIGGTCPIDGADVKHTDWQPDESKKNVLVPYVWTTGQRWMDHLTKAGKALRPIKEAVELCRQELRVPVGPGSIQLELID